jgi:hypothetical protein
LIAAGDHEAAAVTLYTHLDRSRQAKARIMCAESAKRPA